MEGYYTVTQYSKMTGKDVGNIRRMLIKGLLKGEKVGNQWLIPSDAIYPEDRRVRTGRYHNSRKRQMVYGRHKELLVLLDEMSAKIQEVYGGALEKIMLYGSYARGDETQESDVDIALIIDGKISETLHDRLIDIVMDYELELGTVLSVVPIDSIEFEAWKHVSPFYKNVEKEGIILWKKV